MISMSVFDWFRNEPQPPEYYAPVPEVECTSESIAIGALGLDPETRLKEAESIAVLCKARGLAQKHVMKAVAHHRLACRDNKSQFAFRMLQLACHAPSRRLSTAARKGLVSDNPHADVLQCLRLEVPWNVTDYTLIYRPKIRWRYKKAMKYFQGPHAEADRVYVAAMAPGFRNWQRKTLFGQVSDTSAREYFEIKTGVTL